MLEAIPNEILKNTSYYVSGRYEIIRQDRDYKVVWNITETIIFELYKDGYWSIQDLESNDIILEGKSTSPTNKYWITRLINSGYSEVFAYAENMEWKSIGKK